jgi:hypothetical protein
LLLLIRAESESAFFAPTRGWTATTATAQLPAGLQPGWFWARTVVAGMASNARSLLVTLPVAEACASSSECTTSSCASGVCCASACSGPCDVCAFAAGAPADGTCVTLSASACSARLDGGSDAGSADAGAVDGGTSDGGSDGGVDAGVPDGGEPDGGVAERGPVVVLLGCGGCSAAGPELLGLGVGLLVLLARRRATPGSSSLPG